MESKKNQKEEEKEEVKGSEEQHHHSHPELEQDHIPASEHEFPSYGHAQTDFVTRNHGRSSHRMTDHEPGGF
ncbi:hypothetical protein [Pedobacter jamesrossensis]|uniref:Uncharacterized protein n=1 Tax=Pedobacter jamesrossensis TaxID=1908238 RepID=A0ABV8NK82_9SPHI